MPIKIVASWDDGCHQDMRLADLMAKYEVKSIFYWPVFQTQYNLSKGHLGLTDQQADQIASQFEIGSHTLSHPHLTKIDPPDAEVEISQSRVMLQKRFGQEINSFCYPRGYANEEIKSMVRRAGYTNARNVLVGSLQPALDDFWTPTTVHVGYDRKEYGGRSWQQYAHDKFLEAQKLERKGKEVVYHIWGHSYEIDRDPVNWIDLEKLLKRITA